MNYKYTQHVNTSLPRLGKPWCVDVFRFHNIEISLMPQDVFLSKCKHIPPELAKSLWCSYSIYTVEN